MSVTNRHQLDAVQDPASIRYPDSPRGDDPAAMFSELEDFLKSLSRERFVYVPNPGNAGDALIAHATYQMFDRLGLDYEVGDELRSYPERVVVWGGGGNLVPLYINLNNFLLLNARHCKRLIVLPHTIYGHETTLAQLGSNCEIFCRDQMSFDFARRHAPGASVTLSHDLAFSLDPDQTRRDAGRFPIPWLSNAAFARRNVKRQLRTASYSLRCGLSHGTLNCFREDLEKTAAEIPARNIDVSSVFASGIMTKVDALEAVYRMMRFVDGFERVNTNRLHIAILGTLLGKEVNFYPNSYGKNQAVYEHSIAGRFPNVRWHG